MDGRARRFAAPPADPRTLFDAADVLHGSPSAVAILDAESRFAYLNERAQRYVGAAQSLIGRDIFEVFPELTSTSFETALLAAMRGRAPVRLERFENPVSRRAFFVLIMPLRTGVIVHFRDVTHLSIRQKQQAAVAAFGLHALLAQESTRESLLDEAMRSVREALDAEVCGFFSIVIRPEGDTAHLVAGSGWREGLVGEHSEDLSGDSHVAVTARNAEPVAFTSAPIDSPVRSAEYPLLAEHRIQSGLSVVVQSAEGLYGVIVAYNTRERNFTSDDLNCLQSIANAVAGLRQRWDGADALAESEQRLRQAQKMEAVGRLAGGIAHDFNNLLTLIHSYSEMAIVDLAEHDAIRADVEQIKLASQRAAALTRQLLAFSRRQVLLPREIRLNDVIEGLQKMLLRVIGADVELTVDLAPDLSAVFADPGQFEQVLMNLVLNSRYAMPAGGRITISSRNVTVSELAQLRWTEATPGAYVEVTVADTGSGIPADALPHVFEPFFSTKERGRGTGLGLSTVYGIITQSGGLVRAESTEGQGTTIRIMMPPYRVDAEAAAQPQPAPIASRRGSETILLVEDDDAVRALAKRILGGAGYAVLEATNGEDALLLFARESKRIDLVLTDIVMPRMSGRAFVRELAGRNSASRVLFMSGYTEDEIVRLDLLPPGTRFLEKPFSVQGLLGAVRSALE